MLDKYEYADGKECIGVIGYSYSLVSLFSFLNENKDKNSAVELLGAVLLDASGDLVAHNFDFPVYENVKAMLAKQPDINMVFDLGGLPEIVRILRDELPLNVTLVELPAARFFLKLQATDRLWIACKADLMQTQGLFKSVVDQMPEEILVIGNDGMILDANSSFCSRTGFSLSKLRGLNPLAFYDGIGGLCPVEDGVVRPGLMVGEGQSEFLTHETNELGKMKYFRFYVYPIVYEDAGKVVQLVMIRRDITERTLLEQRIHQSERMATVGELSAYIAHEVRNPLMAMGGFANILLNNFSIDEAGREKIRIIFDEARRLDALVTGILDFLRSGDVKKSSFYANSVVAEALQMLSLGCQIQGIEVELDLDSNDPEGMGAAEQIKECVMNLIRNSMEAMPDGGKIIISTGLSGDRVWLEIRDDGPGISDNIRAQVFDPFYSSKLNGNGLGLPMVKKIVEEFGGEVELASKEGNGTSVAILLPVVSVAKKASTE